MKKLGLRDLTAIAAGAALIAVCSWISIPAAIPFTMQTFGVCLITALLGKRNGTLSVIVFILLGAVGVPVFSGFTGGIPVLLGTTGGYIIGFIFTALIVGTAVDRFGYGAVALAAAMAVGILVCYAFGTAWFMAVYAKSSGPIGIAAALSWCVFPYLIPDAVKIALAVLITGRLHRFIGKGEKG